MKRDLKKLVVGASVVGVMTMASGCSTMGMCGASKDAAAGKCGSDKKAPTTKCGGEKCGSEKSETKCGSK